MTHTAAEVLPPAEIAVFPPYLQIETVARCNARCTMCTSRNCHRATRLMTDELFAKIADELACYSSGIKRVTIQGLGEPLLDNKLEPRIRTLKDGGVTLVAFATNGSLMNAERARSVLDSGVDEVTFSVDGITQETYESIRTGLNFDEVLGHIEQFVRLRDQAGAKTIIRIRWTAQRANQDELRGFDDFWENRLGPCDSAYAKIIHTWGNAAEYDELPDNYDFERLNRLPCPSLWTSLIIFSDGQIPLCCSDYDARIRLGDVHRQTIVDVWNSPTLARLREKHLAAGRGGMTMCANCVVWDDEAKISPRTEK
ncbi:MAG: radical SAM protein [Sedimentisphaerales bacterium]|nr:radical SAM protein [Sedimentisphaerales bacterium]